MILAGNELGSCEADIGVCRQVLDYIVNGFILSLNEECEDSLNNARDSKDTAIGKARISETPG